MVSRPDPPIDIPDDQDRKTALSERILDKAFANIVKETAVTGIMLVIYVVPGVILAVELNEVAPLWLIVSLPLALPALVLLRTGLFYYVTGKACGSDDPNEDMRVKHQVDTEWPWTFLPTFGISRQEPPTSLSDQDVEVLLVEYE